MSQYRYKHIINAFQAKERTKGEATLFLKWALDSNLKKFEIDEWHIFLSDGLVEVSEWMILDNGTVSIIADEVFRKNYELIKKEKKDEDLND